MCWSLIFTGRLRGKHTLYSLASQNHKAPRAGGGQKQVNKKPTKEINWKFRLRLPLSKEHNKDRW